MLLWFCSQLLNKYPPTAVSAPCPRHRASRLRRPVTRPRLGPRSPPVSGLSESLGPASASSREPQLLMGHFRLTFTWKPDPATVNCKKCSQVLEALKWQEEESEAKRWSGLFSSTLESLVSCYLFSSSAYSLHLNFHFQHWLNNLPMENVKRVGHKVLCEHSTNFVEVEHYLRSIFTFLF